MGSGVRPGYQPVPKITNLTYDVTFSPNDTNIYSVSDNGVIVEWQVGDINLTTLKEWIADNRYVRDLSCEEKAQFGIGGSCP
jgi:hypothetical protein